MKTHHFTTVVLLGVFCIGACRDGSKGDGIERDLTVMVEPGDGGTDGGIDSGTSGGADGSAMPQSCTAVPAVGTWDATSIAPVSATPGEPSYQFDGKAVAIVVDPFDPSTVWLGTGNKGLYKSTDCGGTWAKVNTGKNGTSLDQSVLWSMVIDPVNRGAIYAVGAYGAEGLWKSTNGGVDWDQLFPANSQLAQLVPNNFVANVSMDASDPKHLVVTSHGVCNSPYTNGCLAESTDGGETWPNIVGMPATWGERGGVQVINATTWIWGTGDNFDGTFVTTDNGKHWNQVLAAGAGDANGELSMQPLQRANDGAFYVTSIEGVLRSTDGVAWTLAWMQQSGQSPLVTGIAVTPTTIYASDGTSFYSAPLNDYAKWTMMVAPNGLTSDASAQFLAYDGTHKLLYASCWSGGVYRFHTN